MSHKLLLDTTQEHLMLALADEIENIIFQCTYYSTSYAYHSATLLPMIEKALKEHQTGIQEISAVGVNIGPGSFTGIRTGLTVARLLGQFLPMTVFGFNHFELLAANSVYRNQVITILLNAFRQQHYRATLRVEDTGQVHWLESPAVFPNDDILSVTADACLVDPSLNDKITLPEGRVVFLDDDPVFTPASMFFLLSKNPEPYQTTWQNLLPLYLQLPHITPKKTPV